MSRSGYPHDYGNLHDMDKTIRRQDARRRIGVPLIVHFSAMDEESPHKPTWIYIMRFSGILMGFGTIFQHSPSDADTKYACLHVSAYVCYFKIVIEWAKIPQHSSILKKYQRFFEVF